MGERRYKDIVSPVILWDAGGYEMKYSPLNWLRGTLDMV